MPSEWDRFLEGLAREIDNLYDGPMRNGEILDVLRAKLLPLLEAGQAYYEIPPGIDQKFHDAWRVAREAALKK